ncbi:hypothetical protein [Enterococcus faecalis]|uniref:hypothetical protein n=1 Tax=Enterococcus faecalis TaxID=1351 RepID=UPI0034CD9E0B
MLLIEGFERGNAYGCTYSICFFDNIITVMIIWGKKSYSYNEEEINKILNDIEGLSKEFKITVKRYIQVTNELFYLSYKELH